MARTSTRLILLATLVAAAGCAHKRPPILPPAAGETPTGPVKTPAPTPIFAGEERHYGAVPALGSHSAAIRKEFGGG